MRLTIPSKKDGIYLSLTHTCAVLSLKIQAYTDIDNASHSLFAMNTEEFFFSASQAAKKVILCLTTHSNK